MTITPSGGGASVTGKEREAIREIMDIIANDCGSDIPVGNEGPTLGELTEYWKITGEPWEGDNEYDICQQTWRRLELLVSE